MLISGDPRAYFSLWTKAGLEAEAHYGDVRLCQSWNFWQVPPGVFPPPELSRTPNFSGGNRNLLALLQKGNVGAFQPE